LFVTVLIAQLSCFSLSLLLSLLAVLIVYFLFGIFHYSHSTISK